MLSIALVLAEVIVLRYTQYLSKQINIRTYWNKSNLVLCHSSFNLLPASPLTL